MQDYNDFIAHETDIFFHFCGLTADDVIPEDLTQQLTGDLQDIYRQVRYTVNEADRDGNVTVDIEPLDLTILFMRNFRNLTRLSGNEQ